MEMGWVYICVDFCATWWSVYSFCNDLLLGYYVGNVDVILYWLVDNTASIHIQACPSHLFR